MILSKENPDSIPGKSPERSGVEQTERYEHKQMVKELLLNSEGIVAELIAKRENNEVKSPERFSVVAEYLLQHAEVLKVVAEQLLVSHFADCVNVDHSQDVPVKSLEKKDMSSVREINRLQKEIEEEQFLYQRDLSSLGQFTEENLWQSQKELYEKVPDDIRLKLEEAYESDVRTFHNQLQAATEQVNMDKTGWLIRQIEARNKQFSHDKHNVMVKNVVVPVNESVIREKREEEWIELKHWKKVEKILAQYEKRIAKRNITDMILRTVFS